MALLNALDNHSLSELKERAWLSPFDEGSRATSSARTWEGAGAGAYGTRIRCNSLFGVLLRLPTAPGLPLYETETSVRRRFWAALGQAAAGQYLVMWGVGRKEQWPVEKLRADLIR